MRSSFRHHLALWATAMLPGLVTVAGIEAAGTVVTGSFGFGAAAAAFVYLLGLYGLATIPVVLFGAIGSRYAPERPLGYDWVWAISSATMFALFVTAIYALNLWVRETFSNVELSSLLAAVAAAIVAAVLLAATRGFERFVRRTKSRAGQRVLLGAASFGAISALVWVLGDNRSGLEQLSTWLLAIPVALSFLAIAGAATGRWWVKLSGIGLTTMIATLVAGIGAVCVMELTDARTPSRLAEFAPLTSWVAGPIQALSDFDNDGYGAWLGGQDCAPFDPDIAPGKLDIPGDGIDNNCIGGDAKPGYNRQKPEWFALPEDWSQHNVLFVTVDTLRWDHVGFMGYERDTTPNLDKLAERATVFEHFYATSTFTRLALPSLFTSRTPSRVEWQRQKNSKHPRVMETNPWLPSSFNEADYATAAITADFPAFTDKDNMGFERGFDNYDASTKLRYRGGTMRGFPSDGQVKRAREWLDETKEQPFFLWVHFFEPHYLYEQFPGAPKFGKERIDKYDSEIWGADRAIGKLLDYLEKSGRADDTIVVVLGDHGEEFEEHGKRYHGSNLYEPQVRTPLVIFVPGRPARRISTPASFADVPSTVVNLAGVKNGFDQYDGRNLTPVFFGEPIPDAALILEVWKITVLRSYKIAVLNWPYKLIANGTAGEDQELYDLVNDPGEKTNLHRKKPDVTESMQSLLHDYLDHTELDYAPAPTTAGK